MPFFFNLELLNMSEEEQFFSLDVECFATGNGHSDRAPVTVAVVNSSAEVVLDKVIDMSPGVAVASFFTELTGISEETYSSMEKSTLDEVIQQVKEIIGPNAVIVGQGIQNDIKWLRVRGFLLRSSVLVL
jgi:RNA exonuclease 4